MTLPIRLIAQRARENAIMMAACARGLSVCYCADPISARSREMAIELIESLGAVLANDIDTLLTNNAMYSWTDLDSARIGELATNMVELLGQRAKGCDEDTSLVDSAVHVLTDRLARLANAATPPQKGAE